MASIRAHLESRTLIITKNSTYARPINHHIGLILGINARCLERVMIDGDLELGKKAEITGSVKAKNAILGPGSVIYGDLMLEGDLTALDNAKVTGHVMVMGAAFIRPGVLFGSLDAGGLIELQGNPPSKHIKGKMVDAGGLIELQGNPPSKHIKGKMVVNDGTDYREPLQQKNEHEVFKKPKPEEDRVVLPPKAPVIEPAKGKAPAKKGKPQKKAKEPDDEKPKRKGLFGLFK